MTAMQFSPKSTIIRQFIEGYKPWLEERLGVSMNETIQLRFYYDIGTIAASMVLPGAKFSVSDDGAERTLQERMVRIELPPDVPPAIAMTIVTDEAASITSKDKLWKANWLDCPVAIHL